MVDFVVQFREIIGDQHNRLFGILYRKIPAIALFGSVIQKES
ncbi:MAG: hypothetical protein VKL42_04260 [Snowella sp.]|nr:hypothetical protein [Snowella sp.]